MLRLCYLTLAALTKPYGNILICEDNFFVYFLNCRFDNCVVESLFLYFCNLFVQQNLGYQFKISLFYSSSFCYCSDKMKLIYQLRTYCNFLSVPIFFNRSVLFYPAIATFLYVIIITSARLTSTIIKYSKDELTRESKLLSFKLSL